MAKVPPYRLPKTVIPERYEIRLTPDLGSFTFEGEEMIFLTVQEPVREIVVNAIELSILEAVLADADGKILPGTIATDARNERAVFTFGRTVQPGRCRLRLAFSGTLNDKLHGFYRSSYKDDSGRVKTLAATQFEATDARRAFPCWDEPEFKAVFQVTLVVDKDLTAISNSQIVRETAISGKKEVVFADTIRMSTYLVAFIVGEFEGTDPVNVDGVHLRVWAVPGKRPLANFAQAVGGFSLSFFRRYYGKPYPGDKLDLIAIPDFASGAMENLGAITFRETALLVDEATATRSELERIADVVSHENAHMWFGDLVTMRWWNGLWLNEAFATFMEMLAVDAWKPEWRRWDSFALSRAAALLVDGLRTTRPIEFTVERPEDAAAMFDVLTYEKGAAVLRMLEQYLGPAIFQRGISRYLDKHEYGNAETSDLWKALEESSGQPARELMDTWIFQAGYPLITVKAEESEIILGQRLFRYLPDGDGNEPRWQIPVLLRLWTAHRTENQRVLLTEPEMRLGISAAPDRVLVNAGGHGFYRVHYDSRLLKQLTIGLQQNLSAVERFNLLNDTWATALAGLTSLDEFLDFVQGFKDDTDHNVWSTILAACHYLCRVADPHERPSLSAFARSLIFPTASRLGWAPEIGEPELTSQLRGELLQALGTLAEDPSIQEKAYALFERYKRDRSSIDRNIVPALISIAAHCGTEKEYEEFLSNFKNAKTPQEEQRYLFALAGFRHAELAERTLQLAVNGEVRSQNAPYLVRALLFNIEARELAWAFIKSHWEEMARRYPDNAIPRMCEGIVCLVARELEADVRQFLATHPVKQGGRIIDQHLEKLRIAVLCQERWVETLKRMPY